MKTNKKDIISNKLNALYIDDSNSSVNYQTSSIDNECILKINNLEEFSQLYKSGDPNLFKYDTVNCISIILSDGTEISLHEYRQKMNPVFLKISTDELRKTGNDILINIRGKNHLILKEHWTSDNRNYSCQILPDKELTRTHDAVDKDINGFKNTKKLAAMGDLSVLPALRYCVSQKIQLCVSGAKYKGYLPAIGQLKIIGTYIDLINYVFDYIEQSELPNGPDDIFWSSSEFSDIHMCCLESGLPSYCMKCYKKFTLPFFKLITD